MLICVKFTAGLQLNISIALGTWYVYSNSLKISRNQFYLMYQLKKTIDYMFKFNYLIFCCPLNMYAIEI